MSLLSTGTLAADARLNLSLDEFLVANETPRLTDPINRRIPSQIVWHNNYDEALEIAQREEKPLLVLFTGSDWCTWCIRLEEEALETEAFSREASDLFVFVKLDFPSRKQQPSDQRRQNRKLKRRFGVRGFPTVLLVNPQEEVIAETGYEPGGGRAYARHLQQKMRG
jgi:protein disulfide-isomerase